MQQRKLNTVIFLRSWDLEIHAWLNPEHTLLVTSLLALNIRLLGNVPTISIISSVCDFYYY